MISKNKKCKHRGYWFEDKGIILKRWYLYCMRCHNAIPEKEVFRNAEILHSDSNGLFITSEE